MMGTYGDGGGVIGEDDNGDGSTQKQGKIRDLRLGLMVPFLDLKLFDCLIAY